MERKVSERLVIFLVAAVQLVNILDFVMVMPLGPDLSVALGIPTSAIGLISGSYTLSAACAGIVGSFFLDRFDRRKALQVCMMGLAAGTALGGFSTGLRSLMFARVVAGMFGGPATSLAFSIIADVVPAERRGKALGTVMGAFSVAQVLGVPASLRSALWFGWRVPFFGVAGMGILISLSALFFLPPLTGHLNVNRGRPTSLRGLLGRSEVLISYTMTAVVMMAGFILIPSITPYVLFNLHYPRGRLDLLYASGGLASIVVLQFAGRLVDRFGSFRVGTFGSILFLGVLWIGFIHHLPQVPVFLLFVGFMGAMGFRNVAYNTLTNKVPGPTERAQFMSIQSAVQHLASASAAILSSFLLSQAPDLSLIGVERLGSLSLGLTLLVPALLYWVERRVEARKRWMASQQAVGALSAAPVVAPASPAP